MGRIIFMLLLFFVQDSVSLSIIRSHHNQSTGRVCSLEALVDDSREDVTVTTATPPCMSDENIAEHEKQFKIVTCMSTACSQKRQSLGMDSLSTFGSMYSQASASQVQVEEGPCMGSCKKAPCVSIEHEDFFGSVALEGMTADEFSSDAFLNIVTEDDADRVWSCVENAVKLMAEAAEEEED